MSDDRRRLANVPGLAVIAAILLIVGGGALAVTAGAADPDEGTVSLDERMTGWNGMEYALEANQPVGCFPTPCDEFTLTVDIPKSHWEENLGGAEVQIQWESEEDDFDLFVDDANGDSVGTSARGGTSSERVLIQDANAEDGPYTIRVSPYDVQDSGYLGGVKVESRANVFPEGGEVPTEPLSNAPCQENGLAADTFQCQNVDLASFLPIESMGGRPAVCPNDPANCGDLNDIWGWTDPETGSEYALVGRTNGTSFVDVSDPSAPVYLGDLASHGDGIETIFNVWRDIKVYKDHAFIVSEEPDAGLQVFDLTKLRDASREEPTTFSEDASYSLNLEGPASVDPIANAGRLGQGDNTHNLSINEESGFAYLVGSSTCGGGGPHMVNIQDPTNPTFAGCTSEDGYTHDNQCVNYRQGDPDPDHPGREICFNANEDTLTIVDVTEKDDPKQLSSVPYDTAAYTHQGWLTEDRRFFIVNDELDELGQGGATKTYIFDVQNLENPQLTDIQQGRSESIDHNNYVRNDRLFQANYRSGLSIRDAGKAAEGSLPEVGYFDVFPADNAAEFNGAWSNYPYFESGTVVVSGIESGLFVLRPQGEARAEREPGANTPAGTTPTTTTRRKRCGTAPKRVRGKRIGRARLGRKRAANRRALGRQRGSRRFVDRFCLRGRGGLRIGYPTRAELRRLPRSQRRRVRGRAILVLSSSPRSRARGVRPGTSRRALVRRIGRAGATRVGRQTWYTRRGKGSRLVFKVRRGKVREVGVANLRLTRGGEARVNRFFRNKR